MGTVVLQVAGWTTLIGMAVPTSSRLPAPNTQPKICCSCAGVRAAEEIWRKSNPEDRRGGRNIQSYPNSVLIDRLVGGKCDAVIYSGTLSEDEQRKLKTAFRGKAAVEQYPIGCRVVSVVCSTRNPISSLTTEQLGQIFSGKVSQWEAVGGPARKIVAIGQSSDSNSAYILKTHCFPHGYLRADLVIKETPEAVVAAVAKDAGAIGFLLGLADPAKLKKEVKLLRIGAPSPDGVVTTPALPTPVTISESQYPLIQPLILILPRKHATDTLRRFCDSLGTPETAKMLSQRSLFSEYDRQRHFAAQRVAEVKAGKGTEIVVCDLVGKEDVLNDLSLEFVKAKAAVQLKFQKGETRDTAIEKLAKGATDLLLVDGKSGEVREERGERSANPKLAEKGTVPGTLQGEGQSPFLRSIELGRMAVGVIVHPENPLESLPIDEAKSIFCGEIKKWPAVRGAAAAMHVFGLRNTNPIAQLLREKLADAALTPALSQGARGELPFNRDPKGSARPATLKCTAQPDSEKVILAVARDPAAIGFVDMSQLPPNDKSVKLVPVFGRRQGDSPIFVERKLGQSPIPNPLSRTLTLYVSPNASQTAKDFAEFLTPEHCKAIIAQYNLLPPLHAEGAKLAKGSRPHPSPLPTNLRSVPGEGTVALASADEPIPPLLDDPDAPQDQGRAKIKKLAAKPKPVIPAPEQPAPPKVTADAQPAPETESEPAPTQSHPGAPSLTDEQIVWLVGGIAGVVLLALGVGWLQAPHRKRKRR